MGGGADGKYKRRTWGERWGGGMIEGWGVEMAERGRYGIVEGGGGDRFRRGGDKRLGGLGQGRRKVRERAEMWG